VNLRNCPNRAIAFIFHSGSFPERLANAEHAQRDGKPIDLGQQFRLLLLVHARTRVIQKPLVIPANRKCALANQKDDQTGSQKSEEHRYNYQCHNPNPADSSWMVLLSSTQN
jgi:hypothetical protein